MVVGIQTMILNNKQRQKQQGSPNWWWLDAARNNNNNGDATQRSSPWLRSALSELDKTTTAMLKLIEADADSFAQRAEMYYKKRPELIGVVEEFYRMHRSLATRFDQLKSDSATRLLMTLGSPFSCNGQVPLGKSFSLSPGVYKNYDAHSDISDDHEDNPESEVEDPEDDSGTEATSPKEEFRGKPVDLDEEVLTRADGSDEIQMLKEEVERLKEENKALRDEMAQKDAESKEALGRLSMSMYEIARIKEENKIQRDEMARQEEQKVDMIRELTVSMDEKKKLKEQNNENKREGTRPLRAASTDVPKENGPSQKKVKPALPNLGKAGNPIDSETTQGGNFLRRLFPKSSKKSKVTNALSFGTLSLGF